MSAAAYRSLLAAVNLDSASEGFRRMAARGGVRITKDRAAGEHLAVRRKRLATPSQPKACTR